MAVKPIPDGFSTVTPYLVVKGVGPLIDFMKKTFKAEELEVMKRPDGSIMHAEVKIGNSPIMMGEARDGQSPMPTTLYVYVEDTDATYKSALAAGATSQMEPTDQFWGDRNAAVKDASGNHWWIATRVEEVPPDEMRRRAEKMAQK
jgi:uncharacterized glyoxalase superfamily protein PhnB